MESRMAKRIINFSVTLAMVGMAFFGYFHNNTNAGVELVRGMLSLFIFITIVSFAWHAGAAFFKIITRE
jgi:hypothetical protein